MTDLVLAECHLPESPVRPGYYHEVTLGTPAAGLVISVSNDGEHKSFRNLTFISYDSACMSCNVTTGCVLKVSAVWYHSREPVSRILKKNWYSIPSGFWISKATFVCFWRKSVFTWVHTCFYVLVISVFAACPVKINIPLNVFYKHL